MFREQFGANPKSVGSWLIDAWSMDYMVRTYGVKGFGRKFEVLDPYRYHVAVENHVAEHHWTEKIADALLCECLPFYAGDPALSEVLPPDSFIPIPLDDPAEAERIVCESIAAGEYEKRLPAIREAKRLLLTKFNFWAQVLAIVKSAPPVAASDGGLTLLPRKAVAAAAAAVTPPTTSVGRMISGIADILSPASSTSSFDQ